MSARFSRAWFPIGRKGAAFFRPLEELYSVHQRAFFDEQPLGWLAPDEIERRFGGEGRGLGRKWSRRRSVLASYYFVSEETIRSVSDFYGNLERALGREKIPDLRYSRILRLEGGLLSPRRLYLRVSHGRLYYDICAAPFGRSFFISLRLKKRRWFIRWLYRRTYFTEDAELLFRVSVLRIVESVHAWMRNPRGGVGCELNRMFVAKKYPELFQQHEPQVSRSTLTKEELEQKRADLARSSEKAPARPSADPDSAYTG